MSWHRYISLTSSLCFLCNILHFTLLWSPSTALVFKENGNEQNTNATVHGDTQSWITKMESPPTPSAVVSQAIPTAEDLKPLKSSPPDQHSVYVVAYMMLCTSIAVLVCLISAILMENRMRTQAEEAARTIEGALTSCSEPALSKLPLSAKDTMSFSELDDTMFVYSTGGQLLKYDPFRATSTLSLFNLKNSAVMRSVIVWRIFSAIVLAATACGFLVASQAEGWTTMFQIRLDLMLDTTVNFFTGLVGILLGFYISTVLGRWWSIRQEIGKLWGAVDDMHLIVSAIFRSSDWQPLKNLILRYCMLSFELAFLQAKSKDDLQILIDRNLLTREEMQRLNSQPSKPQIVWTWIATLMQQLADEDMIDQFMLLRLHGFCVTARGAIGAIFMYLDTQLPYIYVHLLSILVHANTILVALRAGSGVAIQIAKVQTQTSDDPKGKMELIGNIGPWLVVLVMQPLFYNACLEIGAIMQNPLQDDFHGFPQRAFHAYMRNECEAFHNAGEDAPEIIGNLVQSCRKIPLGGGQRQSASSSKP